MKYAQLVVGPAGSGKVCVPLACLFGSLLDHSVHLLFGNPKSLQNDWKNSVCGQSGPGCRAVRLRLFHVRELISVDDVLEEEQLVLGPNGALVYCMEYLAENLEWLHAQLNEAEDDYFLFDCPGQIELYSHLTVMRQLAQALREWDFSVCSVFVLDTSFCLDPNKFISATLTALSTTVSLQTPAMNVLSKMDLLNEADRGLVTELIEGGGGFDRIFDQQGEEQWNEKHRKLTEAIATVIEDYSLIKFMPLNVEEEETIEELLQVVDNTIQYGENAEVKDRYPEVIDRD